MIEVEEAQLPAAAVDVEQLSARLVEEAVRWVDACAAERHIEVV